MLRRLHPEQPDSFAFTPDNQKWAEGQISKYPEGRQASAIIPLLWRAQEQEGWLSRAAIEHVAAMLDMAYIRALEVATFYFMFQLQPVGRVAHFQICGTTSCMICGAEDLVAVCKEKIAPKPHQLSSDGKFSWKRSNASAPVRMLRWRRLAKTTMRILTAERFAEIIDELSAGKVPTPGPQNGRFAAEPLSGLTSLAGGGAVDRAKGNASVALAAEIGDTVKRIDGTEVPLLTPWLGKARRHRRGHRSLPSQRNLRPRNRQSPPILFQVRCKRSSPAAMSWRTSSQKAWMRPRAGRRMILRKLKGSVRNWPIY